MKPLAQQTILITGSTDGLGKQTALALASQGATVLLHGRNQHRLETTRREIQDVTGNRHLETYLADLAELSEVRSLSERVRAHHPQLDMLINNAGVGGGKLLGVEFPRIWRVREEKSAILEPGGFNGQISTDLHARIQTTSSRTL